MPSARQGPDQVPVRTIVSGGQTGVDRAALDAARARGIPYGGWCPHGGGAEDMGEPPGLLARYRELRQTPDHRPEQRTTWNVRDSDVTLILLSATGIVCSAGTIFTQEKARHFCKPALVLELGRYESLHEAAQWLDNVQADLALNVAGPRESEAPGIYEAVRLFLDELISSADAFAFAQ
jgi:hypothetical protein